jgi:DNA-binding NtrC family response regulator
LIAEENLMDVFERLKEMRILLIDDDEWIRDSLQLFLECEGCHLECFESAEQGWEELRKRQYDIIIVDYRLPGMNGLELLERIKGSHPNLKKILITAYRSDKIVSEAKKIGVEDFIEKPFSSKTIEDSLMRLVCAGAETKEQI